MSDSHDNLPAIRKAVDFFNEKKVSLVLHAGDIISPFTVEEFKRLGCRMRCVYGNNDGERSGLSERLSSIGAEIADVVSLEHEGARICLYHGTFEEMVHAMVECGRYDVVVRGHSHRQAVDKRGETVVINPGEACGYLTGKKTVALFDAEDKSARIYEL
jgi:hypothetical protein